VRVIVLNPVEVVIVDTIAWFLIHMIISITIQRIPVTYFANDSFLFRIRKWENNGRIWNEWFKVKAWKHYIPDGKRLIGNGFEKKQLKEKSREYLSQFLMESRRAELTHWISIIPAPFFFLWNPIWAGWVMIVYALVFNIPIILTQRYNRPRLKRALERFSSS